VLATHRRRKGSGERREHSIASAVIQRLMRLDLKKSKRHGIVTERSLVTAGAMMRWC
jgi:hypothetical protein